MLLHRSISQNEFDLLLKNSYILGRYNMNNEKQASITGVDIVSFFVDDFWWVDSRHSILLCLNIPEDRLQFGIGKYWASKKFGETHIWTGRTGSYMYELREAYINRYNLSDVVGVSFVDRSLIPYEVIFHLRNLGIKEISYNDILTKNREPYSSNDTDKVPLVDIYTPNTVILRVIKDYLGAKFVKNSHSELSYKGYIIKMCFDNKNGNITRYVVVESNNSRVLFSLNENVVSELKCYFSNKG